MSDQTAEFANGNDSVEMYNRLKLHGSSTSTEIVMPAEIIKQLRSTRCVECSPMIFALLHGVRRS